MIFKSLESTLYNVDGSPNARGGIILLQFLCTDVLLVLLLCIYPKNSNLVMAPIFLPGPTNKELVVLKAHLDMFRQSIGYQEPQILEWFAN